MRKFLVYASFAGLLLTGAAARVRAASPAGAVQQAPQNPEQATKTISGKVIAIGSNGTSFTLQLAGSGTDTNNNNTIQFQLDRAAKVQGTVRVGTMVTVEYAQQGSQNTAVAVTAQG